MSPYNSGTYAVALAMGGSSNPGKLDNWRLNNSYAVRLSNFS